MGNIKIVKIKELICDICVWGVWEVFIEIFDIFV